MGKIVWKISFIKVKSPTKDWIDNERRRMAWMNESLYQCGASDWDTNGASEMVRINE